MGTIEGRLGAMTAPTHRRKKRLKLTPEQQATAYYALTNAGTFVAGPDWQSMSQAALLDHCESWTSEQAELPDSVEVFNSAKLLLWHLNECKNLADAMVISNQVSILI